MTDIIGMGNLLEDVVDGGKSVSSDVTGSFNNFINNVFAPFNNLSKSIGSTLESLNPNIIIIGALAVGAIVLLKK
jgi:hypothetical protein